MAWNLERTCQCAKCPWRKDSNPREIPRGYSEEKHRALDRTIAEPDPTPEQIVAAANQRELHFMACHDDHEAICVGWLQNQMSAGNNIPLRIHLLECGNLSEVRLCGEQHPSFEDTLPGTVDGPGEPVRK